MKTVIYNSWDILYYLLKKHPIEIQMSSFLYENTTYIPTVNYLSDIFSENIDPIKVWTYCIFSYLICVIRSEDIRSMIMGLIEMTLFWLWIFVNCVIHY